MISCHKIDAVGRRELAQRLRCSLRVNGRAVIQIAGNENRVRLFPQNGRNQASQEPAVAHVAQVHIADQCCFSPVPSRRQVRKAHRRSCDSCPAGIENSIESRCNCDSEQYFYNPMEVHVKASELTDSVNDPRRSRRANQEREQTHPNRGSPVKHTHCRVRIAKGKQRSRNKAHRQHGEGQADPRRFTGRARCRRKCPRLIEQKMCQKKN